MRWQVGKPDTPMRRRRARTPVVSKACFPARGLTRPTKISICRLTADWPSSGSKGLSQPVGLTTSTPSDPGARSAELSHSRFSEQRTCRHDTVSNCWLIPSSCTPTVASGQCAARSEKRRHRELRHGSKPGSSRGFADARSRKSKANWRPTVSRALSADSTEAARTLGPLLRYIS